MEKSKKNWVVNLKYLFPVYGVAILSFIAGGLRDFIVVRHGDNSSDFFNFIYISAMSSSLIINYVSLGGGKYSKKFLVSVCLLSLLVTIFFSYRIFEESLRMIIFQLILIVFWVWGAIISRRLFLAGHIILGKIRELVASILAIILMLVYTNIYLIFVISVIASTIFINIQSYKLSKKSGRLILEYESAEPTLTRSICEFLLTNISVIAAYSWALCYSSSGDYVFGINLDNIIRISVYAFQAITIGSSLIMIMEWRPQAKFYMVFVLPILIGLVFLVGHFNIAIGVVLMPLLFGVMHWYACGVLKSL